MPHSSIYLLTTALLTAFASLAPSPSPAQSVTVELSHSAAPDVGDSFRPTGVAVEWHSAEFAELGRVRLAFALRASVDDASNSFVGAGISADLPLGRDWFIEAAVIPGYYDAGRAAYDLGSDFEVQSVFGIGRSIGRGISVSLAYTHISNGGLGDTNPGRDALALRLRKTF